MRDGFRRTHATSLSDDELILFDAVFSGGYPLDCLKRGQDFIEIHNFPYTHQLNDDELHITIQRLLDKQLMMTFSELLASGETIQFLTLTENGGALWEKERQPCW